MGTEVITYSRIGKEDIRFGKGTFEVVLADGRKVTINEVDVGQILDEQGYLTLLGSESTEQDIQAAINAAPVGGAVLLAPGTYNISTLTITKSLTFGSLAGIHRTFSTNASSNSGVILRQTSGTKAIHIQAPSSTALNGIRLVGFEVIPSADGSGTDGIYFDAPTGTTIYGIVCERVAVRRFGGIGMNAVSAGTGSIFDITFRDCNLENWTGSGSCIDFSLGDTAGSGLSNQIKFYNSAFTSRSNGVYAVRGAPFELYGVIVQDSSGGACGVDLNGGGIILGGNLEGLNTAGTIGIRYRGSNGCLVAPGSVASWGTGIQIGDGTASAAAGAVIHPSIINNVTQDVLITDGGNRQRTTIVGGVSLTITDNRFTIDGALERFTPPVFPIIATASLPVGIPTLNGAIIIEDAGNLILYAGGLRYRLTGTAF